VAWRPLLSHLWFVRLAPEIADVLFGVLKRREVHPILGIFLAAAVLRPLQPQKVRNGGWPLLPQAL